MTITASSMTRRLTVVAGGAFVLAAAGIAVLAFFLPGTGGDPRDTIVMAAREVRPAWFPVCWGTRAEQGPEGLRIAPLRPGTPWVGFRLQRRQREASRDRRRPMLDSRWRAHGAVRFSIAGGTDSTGAAHPPPALQLFLNSAPDRQAGHPVRVRPWHMQGAGPWYTATVPLSRFEAPRDAAIFAVSFQSVGELHHAFVVRDAALVMLDAADLDAFTTPAPDLAEFPALVELPAPLRPGAAPRVTLRDGVLHGPVGPVFLMGVQLASYDMRKDLWGDTLEPPHTSGLIWEGCPPELAWIYEALPTANSFARVGLNAWAVCPPHEPFLAGRLPRMPQVLTAFDPGRFRGQTHAIDLPLLIDLTLDWTVAELATSDALPAAARAPAGHHFMPFSLTAEGEALYLEYFEKTAAALARESIEVFQFELFNEPDYPVGAALHRGEFARFLAETFPDRARAARDAGVEDGDDAYERIAALPPKSGLLVWRAHHKFLSERFTSLVGRAMETIRRAYGRDDVLFSVQLDRTHAVRHSPLVNAGALYDILPLVASPTDGGVGAFGAGADAPAEAVADTPVAWAPLTADLLLSAAGGAKPILDHEMTCPRDPVGLRRELWTRVLLGFDGVWLFKWSKMAWAWRTEEEGRRHADTRAGEWSLLNPHAHPPAELAAIARFRRELLPHQDLLMPWPRDAGPPRVAYVHSPTNEHADAVLPTDWRLGRAAYALLRYLHVPLAVVTEAQFRRSAGNAGAGFPRVVCLAGTTCLERETFEALGAFASRGGAVLLVNAACRLDEFGLPLDPAPLAGVTWGPAERDPVVIDAVPEHGLPGTVAGHGFRRIEPSGARVLLRDRAGGVRAAVHDVGAGRVYTVSFEGRGYSLLRVLAMLLEREQAAAPWSLTNARTGTHATNVLLSVRDRGNVKAVLMRNCDRYAREVRFAWPDVAGARARLYLDGEPRDLGPADAAGAVIVPLPPEEVRLVVIDTRGEPSRPEDVGK